MKKPVRLHGPLWLITQVEVVRYLYEGLSGELKVGVYANVEIVAKSHVPPISDMPSNRRFRCPTKSRRCQNKENSEPHLSS